MTDVLDLAFADGSGKHGASPSGLVLELIRENGTSDSSTELGETDVLVGFARDVAFADASENAVNFVNGIVDGHIEVGQGFFDEGGIFAVDAGDIFAVLVIPIGVDVAIFVALVVDHDFIGVAGEDFTRLHFEPVAVFVFETIALGVSSEALIVDVVAGKHIAVVFVVAFG